MATSQFDDSSSISKLMAGALLMDGECNDLPFTWPSDTTMPASNSVKMERTPEAFPPNVDCWNIPSHASAFTNNFPSYVPQTNGFGPVTSTTHNGSICSTTDQGQGQNSTGSSPLKPAQDQFRQKYGNYSNEKYPDFNIAVKAETCHESKWSPCALNSNTNSPFDGLINRNNTNVLDEQFSPKSFKALEKASSGNQPVASSNETIKKRAFEFGESDSDSKASGHDSQNGSDWSSCFGGGGGGGGGASVDIDVNQMITSGVTVAGYKPRKIICKRRKSNVPNEQKDTGYWEKRKKNNDSARRSREAKKEKERSFYKRALELEYENHCLKERVAYLERKLEILMQQNTNFTCNDQ